MTEDATASGGPAALPTRGLLAYPSQLPFVPPVSSPMLRLHGRNISQQGLGDTVSSSQSVAASPPAEAGPPLDSAHIFGAFGGAGAGYASSLQRAASTGRCGGSAGGRSGRGGAAGATVESGGGGGPCMRASSANAAHRHASPRTWTRDSSAVPMSAATANSMAGARAVASDERFQFLRQNANVQLVEDPGRLILAELPHLPAVLIAYRSAAARERSPERLHLDRRRLGRCPLLESEERLRLLNYQNNGISRIDNLNCLPNLVFLDLYDNEVQRIENLEPVRNLRVLMLGKNKVRRIENLEGLTRLDVLDLHSNKIQNIENLGHLHELRVLNLAGNAIREMHNMAGLRSLTELNVRRNEISRASGLEDLQKLQRIFASHNQVASIDGVRPLSCLRSLSEIALDGNPVCSMPGYRGRILSVCRVLENLDGQEVTAECRQSGFAFEEGQTGVEPAHASEEELEDGREPATAPRHARNECDEQASKARQSPKPAAAAAIMKAVPSVATSPSEVGSQSLTQLPSGDVPVGGANAAERVGASTAAVTSRDRSRGRAKDCSVAAAPGVPRGAAGGYGNVGRVRAGGQQAQPGVADKQVTSQEVLNKIRSQWTQAIAEGRTPTSRYGYVRREQAGEIAVYGRGLEALDRPEYQSTVNSIQFHFVMAEAVMQDNAARLKRFQHLTSLTFCKNQIFSLDQLEPLKHLASLRHLTITENPVCELRGALRVHAINLLPQLEWINGQQILGSDREARARLFDPLQRTALKSSPVCPRSDRREAGDSRHVASMVGGLVSHACFVDAKLRGVHDCFEEAVRELLVEAWDDMISLEAFPA